MTTPVSIGIVGAAGRMGLRLVALACADPALRVVAAMDRADHPDLGRDVGTLAGGKPLNTRLSDTLGAKPDVIIDFSTPAGLAVTVDLARHFRCGLVVGTTGLGEQHQHWLDTIAHVAPVIQATNYSLVVNVLTTLAQRAATLLGDDYDVEILEAHHRFKKDAPSGTALSLARAVCEVTGRAFDKDVLFARHGDDVPRKPRDLTVQTLRIGDAPGEHTVYFAAPGERLELRHVSTSRDSYARGALAAAKWLAQPQMRPAGRYTMKDVLGLS